MTVQMIRLPQRMPGAEPTAHPGYEAIAASPAEERKLRNPAAAQRMQGQDREIPLPVLPAPGGPRRGEGSFKPEPAKQTQNRIDGQKVKITAPCAAGPSMRDILAQLDALYGPRLSPARIRRIIAAMKDEARDQRLRAPGPIYKIAVFAALRVRIRAPDSRMHRIGATCRQRFGTNGEGLFPAPPSRVTRAPARHSGTGSGSLRHLRTRWREWEVPGQWITGQRG